MFKDELQLRPVVYIVNFVMLKVKRSKHLFLLENVDVRPNLCFLLLCGKFCSLRGCDPIKRAKFRRIYACDVGG